MPLFEYHCKSCDNLFETLVMDSDEVVSCIICKSLDIKKVFSVFGVNNSEDNYTVEDNNNSHGCKSTCCCCN